MHLFIKESERGLMHSAWVANDTRNLLIYLLFIFGYRRPSIKQGENLAMLKFVVYNDLIIYIGMGAREFVNRG